MHGICSHMTWLMRASSTSIQFGPLSMKCSNFLAWLRCSRRLASPRVASVGFARCQCQWLHSEHNNATPSVAPLTQLTPGAGPPPKGGSRLPTEVSQLKTVHECEIIRKLSTRASRELAKAPKQQIQQYAKNISWQREREVEIPKKETLVAPGEFMQILTEYIVYTQMQTHTHLYMYICMLMSCVARCTNELKLNKGVKSTAN